MRMARPRRAPRFPARVASPVPDSYVVGRNGRHVERLPLLPDSVEIGVFSEWFWVGDGSQGARDEVVRTFPARTNAFGHACVAERNARSRGKLERQKSSGVPGRIEPEQPRLTRE